MNQLNANNLIPVSSIREQPAIDKSMTVAPKKFGSRAVRLLENITGASNFKQMHENFKNKQYRSGATQLFFGSLKVMGLLSIYSIFQGLQTSNFISGYGEVSGGSCIHNNKKNTFNYVEENEIKNIDICIGSKDYVNYEIKYPGWLLHYFGVEPECRDISRGIEPYIVRSSYDSGYNYKKKYIQEGTCGVVTAMNGHQQALCFGPKGSWFPSNVTETGTEVLRDWKKAQEALNHPVSSISWCESYRELLKYEKTKKNS